jgi:hypothetical protein
MKLLERYIALRNEAPPEWAVRIEKRNESYLITRCTSAGSFSKLRGGSTFQAALDALEMLITGWAIGSGIRE